MSNQSHDALCQVSHYNHTNYTELVPLPTVSHHDHENEAGLLTRDGAVTTTTIMMPPTANTAAPHVSEAAQERLLARKTRLLEQYRMYPQSTADPHHRNSATAGKGGEANAAAARASALRDTDVPAVLSMLSPTDTNKSTPAYAAEVAEAAGDAATAEPVAASQDLVDLFFMEGSQAVNGMSFSPYPIYGPRNAEERRAAVEKVFEKYHVDTRLPATADAVAAAQRHHDRRHHLTSGVRPHAEETREQYWRRLANAYVRKGVQLAAKAAAEAEAPPFEAEDPFYMIDLGRVIEQMARWRHELPMVRPHFAVKCNPNIAIMEVLAALGAGFDCASRDEIHMVLDNRLVDSPDDIVFANPCKQPGDLREAQACGVTYVTVDNVLEMEKIGRWMPSARAIIRIKTNDGKAKCAFSTKFGASLDDVEGLLVAARRHNVDVYGVSFHVGSGNGDQSAYVSAVRDAHHVFQQAAQHGFNCTVLDIGGGYPGVAADEAAGETSFETIARAMRPVLDELFGGGDVTIISEPGRYFTAATHALAMNVFASRTLRLSDVEKVSCQAFQSVVPMDEPEEYQYYVNDGLYHSFNCIIFDHAHPKLLLLNDGDGADGLHDGDAAEASYVDSEEEGDGTAHAAGADAAHESLFDSAWDRRRAQARRPLRITTIFGPTCDSMDCILKKQPFPEMKLGDWLMVPDMGSYTTAAGCPFNGFSTRRREWVSSVAF